MRRATVLLALAPVVSPISPIPVPAVPFHVDTLGFAPPRDTVILCCQNIIVFRKMPLHILTISTQILNLLFLQKILTIFTQILILLFLQKINFINSQLLHDI